ncbi:hypothetical protein HMPREF1870_00155, partial [Bacteroidales bacterium KA00344]
MESPTALSFKPPFVVKNNHIAFACLAAGLFRFYGNTYYVRQILSMRNIILSRIKIVGNLPYELEPIVVPWRMIYPLATIRRAARKDCIVLVT